MTISVINNSGATVYYMARKLISYSPNTYGWGSADASYNWTNWQAQALANGATKSFSGDRVAVLFHSSDPSSAINSLSAGDSFSADIALWKSGLQSGSVYTFDTGNGSSHNGGSNTWLGYKGSFNSPTNLASDTTGPTISSLSITSGTGVSNSFLNAGDIVKATIVFNENAIVNTTGGTPSLNINVGGTQRAAAYTSGTGSTSLVFAYTIVAGDTNDADGVSIGANSLSLNSGTIKDAAGNNATLTHSAVSANASFKVDVLAPYITSITSTSSDGVYKVGDSINITLNFNEQVQMAAGSLKIHLNLGNVERILSISNSSISGTTSLSTTYAVQAGETAARLEVEKITQNGGTVLDLAGNQLDFTIYAGRNISSTKRITVSLNKDISNDSKHNIGEGRVLNHIKTNCIDEHTGRQVPFRLSFAGISAIRGQSTELGSFYRVTKGNTQQNN